MKNKKEIGTKHKDKAKTDIEDWLQEFAAKNGFHTNVPIFNDSYQTEVAKTLANEVIEKKKLKQ